MAKIKFKYTARDASGNRVEDVIESASQGAAVAALRQMRLSVLAIAPAKKSFFSLSLKDLNKPKPRVKTNDLVIFTRQFATMVDAGLPVIEILDILLDQTDDPGFKLVVTALRSDVRGGSDLSTAVAKYPKVFSPLYVNLIRAGEAAGELDVILRRLAEYLEKAESLKRKVKSAMTYPVISLGMVFSITVFLLVFIVPQFQTIFSSLGVELPLPTRMVLAVSSFLSGYWYINLGVLIGFCVFFYVSRKSPRGRYLWDAAFLKTPVFGELIQKVAISRFSRTFATMLRSGVAILGALEIVATTAGNGVVEEAVNASREAVRQGEALATPLGECPVFPPMVVRMVSVGERTGALESLLEKIADFYDEQVDAAVDALTSAIEPLMIGAMGVIVGGIVLAIFLPIFKMQESVGRRR